MSTRSDVTLRPASAAQRELLTAIHRECFTHYWNPDAFSDFFNVTGTHALVAELTPSAQQAGEGTYAGMLVYRIQHEQSDILTIAVRPHFRRRGIARLLMEEAIRNVTLLQAKQLFLDVEDGNTAAIALYNAFGFEQISRRKLYYRQKEGSYTDALVMQKQLAVASSQLPV